MALVAGLVSLVVSFLPAYITASVSSTDGSPIAVDIATGTSAWTGYAALGMLLIVAATVLVTLRAFSPGSLGVTVPWSLVAPGCAGLGTLLVIVRAFTATSSVFGGGVSVDVGPGWSAWVLFVSSFVLSVFGYLAFAESGERTPGMPR